MKKILFTFLLLFSILNVYSQQTDSQNLSLQELVNKYENLENTRGSILNYFTADEVYQLRNYYAVQNSMNIQLGGFDYSTDHIDIDPVTRAVGMEGMYGQLYKFDIYNPSILNLIGPGDTMEFCGAIKQDNRNEAYTLRYDGSFFLLDIPTGTYTYIGNVNPPVWLTAMAFNPVDGKLYAISNAELYLIDPIALTTQYIGSLDTFGNDAVGLAITAEGNAYTYDLNEDKLYSINLTTGSATAIGYIGFNAAFLQSMAWDPQTNTVYMAAFNFDLIVSDFRSVNLETGMTTSLGQIGTSVLEFYWVDFFTEEQSPFGTCDLTGETTNGPTFNRPTEDGSEIAEEGENVFFSLYGYFHVSASGTYTITSTQDGWDGMIFIYENDFSRNSPLANFVAGNDNFGGAGTSQITTELEAGTLYYLVTTGVNAGEYGDFESNISGPGNVYCNDGNPELGCEWTVSVSGHSYGHFISWKLNAGDELLLSGGHYLTNGFNDTKFITAPGPLSFTIEAGENEIGGSAEYVISNGDQIVASGQIVPGQQKFINNINCTILTEGCLNGPLGQFPTSPFTPTCADGQNTITNTAKTGEYSIVNLTQGIEYIFSSSVETDFITIANETGTLAYVEGIGEASFTPLTTGTYRFYLHLNDDCEYSETGNRSKFIECITPVGPPANDDCENAIPVSCGDVVTGSIYFATNSGGTSSRDVFYKFTGNGQPEVVTLSLCNSEFDTYLSVYSDCSLNNLIMYNNNYCGQASQVSFYSDGISTYYILIEGSSDVWLGSYELEVTCEADEDNYDPCALEQKGIIVTGLGLSDDQWGYSNSTANDFNVLADTQYILEKIIIEVYSTDGEPTTFNVTFHEGETGVGEQFGETIQNLNPTSIQEIGVHSYSNYSVYKVELTLPNPVIFPATGTTDKKYWIALKAAPTVNNGDLNWGSIVKFSPHTLPAWRTQDGGLTWEEYQYGDILRLDGIMSLEGECATLGMDDLSNIDFAYYPNPTKSIVNLETSKNVQSYEVFNLAGQKVLTNKKITQKQVDLSSLNQGTYVVRVTLDGNQIETFKILKK